MSSEEVSLMEYGTVGESLSEIMDVLHFMLEWYRILLAKLFIVALNIVFTILYRWGLNREIRLGLPWIMSHNLCDIIYVRIFST